MKETPIRPRLPGSIKKLNRILSRQRKIEIPEDELEERFVRGWSYFLLALLEKFKRKLKKLFEFHQVEVLVDKQSTRLIHPSPSPIYPPVSVSRRNLPDHAKRTVKSLAVSSPNGWKYSVPRANCRACQVWKVLRV